ncbi:MAG: putative DNA-binding protein [Parcubacteria bacterium C7867-004]|nr:MAG: putative DNA-binding protein [Parcubacteria bacterium C7867-004]
MTFQTLDQQKEAARLYGNGLSAQQVADTLGIHIHTVFRALRKLGVKSRTTRESNRIRFTAQPLSYKVKEDLSYEEERLKMTAVMLYWAEGYKVGKGTVDFANSDPDMVLIFKRFLSEICQVDESRIRGHLYCYEGQDISGIRTFWSRLLSIPEDQFVKPYIKQQATPGIRGPRMVHGLVHVRYCDTKLLKQILCWIDEYRIECVGGGVVNRDWL